MSAIPEMREFASFSKGTQRYIRRSLDVGLVRCNAITRWARNKREIQNIKNQIALYAVYVPRISLTLPEDNLVYAMEDFAGPMMVMTEFDLRSYYLGFPAYRFLYERLFGSKIRPWLPSIFMSVSLLPQIPPEKRAALLSTLDEPIALTKGWRKADPVFFPEWVDKVE